MDLRRPELGGPGTRPRRSGRSDILGSSMGEHLIRFRGGWEWIDLGGDPGAPRRVSLPLDGPPRGTSRVVLTRRFNRPPIDPRLESLALRLEGIPGLLETRLNGRPMALPPGGTLEIGLTWSELRATGNVLALEVDPSTAGDEQVRHPWGMIALVIRQPDPPRGAEPTGGLLGDGTPGA